MNIKEMQEAIAQMQNAQAALRTSKLKRQEMQQNFQTAKTQAIAELEIASKKLKIDGSKLEESQQEYKSAAEKLRDKVALLSEHI